MGQYEYKVIPAPTKGAKGGSDRSPEGRFSFAVETALNDLAGDGWEYVRSDLLPSHERKGLTGSKTVYRTLLVFRRPLSVALNSNAGGVRVSKAAAAAEASVANTAAQPVLERDAEEAKPAKAPSLTAERKAAPAKPSQPTLSKPAAQSDGFMDDE